MPLNSTNPSSTQPPYKNKRKRDDKDTGPNAKRRLLTIRDADSLINGIFDDIEEKLEEVKSYNDKMIKNVRPVYYNLERTKHVFPFEILRYRVRIQKNEIVDLRRKFGRLLIYLTDEAKRLMRELGHTPSGRIYKEIDALSNIVKVFEDHLRRGGIVREFMDDNVTGLIRDYSFIDKQRLLRIIENYGVDEQIYEYYESNNLQGITPKCSEMEPIKKSILVAIYNCLTSNNTQESGGWNSNIFAFKEKRLSSSLSERLLAFRDEIDKMNENIQELNQKIDQYIIESFILPEEESIYKKEGEQHSGVIARLRTFIGKDFEKEPGEYVAGLSPGIDVDLKSFKSSHIETFIDYIANPTLRLPKLVHPEPHEFIFEGAKHEIFPWPGLNLERKKKLLAIVEMNYNNITSNPPRPNDQAFSMFIGKPAGVKYDATKSIAKWTPPTDESYLDDQSYDESYLLQLISLAPEE